jgi:hypothetical protein
VTLFLVLCAAGTLTACSSDSDADGNKTAAPPSKPAKNKATKTADAQARDKQAVLKVYERMWEEQVEAYAKADDKGTDLEKYATKDALGLAMGDMLSMREAGTVTRGAPEHDTKVTSTDLDAKIPRVRLTDCLDVTKWETVKKKTGKALPISPDMPMRYETTVNAEKWGEQWMITKIKTHGDRSC